MPFDVNEYAVLADLDPVLDEIFFDHYNAVPDPLMALIPAIPTSKDKETDFRIGGFTDPTQSEDIVHYDTVDAGYEVEYRPLYYNKGFKTTRRMLVTAQYDIPFAQASSMGTAFDRFRKKTRANLFVNSQTSTVAGYDSSELCATDHRRSKSDSTNVSNLATLALDIDNLNTVINAFEAMGDDLGEENGAMADLLIYGRSNRKAAMEIVDSELNPENATNATNVIGRGLTGIYVPHFGTHDSWYVGDSSMMRRYVKWYQLEPIEFMAFEDEDGLARKYRALEAYVLGWSDFRWVYGSNPG